VRRLLAVALGLLLAASVASAAEWASIRPGDSVQNDVRRQFGQPTKVSSQKVDGYDTTQWRYEGEQAPRGIVRVTVDFGLLTPAGYRPEVVRSMLLEPKPGVFNRTMVLGCWGRPDGIDKENGVDVFKYRSGLLVYFDKAGWIAEKMYFVFMASQAAPAQK
jgi:hypothetical protein